MKTRISPLQKLVRLNRRLAISRWRTLLCQTHLSTLAELSMQFGFSMVMGDVLLLEGRWYVTHTGLIRLARRSDCAGIHARPVPEFSDSAAQRWAFEATVYKSGTCKGFVGYGDADPSNVSPLVRGAEMRVAETRAVNRALRKAYGIGICSIEELGTREATGEASTAMRKHPPRPSDGNGWAQGPRVRDRLCQLIRKHELDPDLVKAYAIDFCGTKTLKDATRPQVENFVGHLADWAEKDRNALLCQLNSYFRVKEGQQPKQEGAA